MNSLDPKYIKSYYRRASANYALGKLKEALKDFKTVSKIVPRDQDSLKKLKQCEKEVRAEAFNKAIESEGGTVSNGVLSLQEIHDIVVESSYDGPRLLEDTESMSNKDRISGKRSGNSDKNLVISLDFIHEVIACFRNQKLLHRK